MNEITLKPVVIRIDFWPPSLILAHSAVYDLYKIRVGRTLFTTRHYFNNSTNLKCNNCSQEMNISEIFREWSISKLNSPLSSLLDSSKLNKLVTIPQRLHIHNIQLNHNNYHCVVVWYISINKYLYRKCLLPP